MSDRTSVTQSIDIPGVSPAEVFAWLTDPTNHAETGAHVVGTTGTDRITAKGDRFGMRMKQVVPYRVTNTVVEYEQDRRLAWRHFAGHRWRYELAPLADDAGADNGAGAGGGVETAAGTRVTETFDLSPLPAIARPIYRTIGFPDAYETNLENSLRRLRDRLTA